MNAVESSETFVSPNGTGWGYTVLQLENTAVSKGEGRESKRRRIRR
jgi:hypothetical protein